MSYKAVNAVRDNSKLTGTDRLMLQTIATYCNHDLNMDGATHTPSMSTLAKGAGCHVNTAKKIITRLLESGELSVRKEGGGRGTRMYYTIHLDVPLNRYQYKENVPLPTHNGTSQNVPLCTNNKCKCTNKVAELELMVHKLESMVHDLQLLVHGMVHNGTSPSRVEGGSNNSNNNKSSNSKEAPPPSSPSPIQELSDYFVELTDCKYVDSRDKWWIPLVEVNQIANGDFNDTKKLIGLAVGILKEKGYTISTPSSILKTASGCYAKMKEGEHKGRASLTSEKLWRGIGKYGHGGYSEFSTQLEDFEVSLIKSMGGWRYICQNSTNKSRFSEQIEGLIENVC